MKKFIIISVGISIAILLLVLTANGITTSTRVQNLFISDLSSTGFILNIDSDGLVSTSTIDSEFASSSITFAFPDATSTEPYRYLQWRASATSTITNVDCYKMGTGEVTSTVDIFITAPTSTSNFATSSDRTVSIGLLCGLEGTASTSAVTIGTGEYITASITNTAGTEIPSLTQIFITLTTNDTQ